MNHGRGTDTPNNGRGWARRFGAWISLSGDLRVQKRTGTQTGYLAIFSPESDASDVPDGEDILQHRAGSNGTRGTATASSLFVPDTVGILQNSPIQFMKPDQSDCRKELNELGYIVKYPQCDGCLISPPSDSHESQVEKTLYSTASNGPRGIATCYITSFVSDGRLTSPRFV